jgi:uncharacterized protein
MFKRTLQKAFLNSARHYPVVTVTGPRQSGKTTLLRQAFPKRAYVNLEEPDQRVFANEDPRAFLAQFKGPLLIDEVQHVPTLLSYVQSIVDKQRKPGQFILSGSQNLLLLESVSQSLAGRAAILHLLPLSFSEIRQRTCMPLAAIGSKSVPANRLADADLFELLWRGQYPRVHATNVAPHDWLRNYYRTYVERDVRSIVNVGDWDSFNRFVRLCAGRNGQLLNAVSLGNDCGVTHSTVKRWLSILEATFIIQQLRPYHRSFSKRIIKAPKLYFLDSGLLCYLLGVRNATELASHASRGAVFESFVLSELLKIHWHQAIEPQLYFWRDSTGHEVDLIMERGGKPVAIEIKSGTTIAGDFYDGLKYWRQLAGSEAPAALFYGGDAQFVRQGVNTYPWSVL